MSIVDDPDGLLVLESRTKRTRCEIINSTINWNSIEQNVHDTRRQEWRLRSKDLSECVNGCWQQWFTVALNRYQAALRRREGTTMEEYEKYIIHFPARGALLCMKNQKGMRVMSRRKQTHEKTKNSNFSLLASSSENSHALL